MPEEDSWGGGLTLDQLTGQTAEEASWGGTITQRQFQVAGGGTGGEGAPLSNATPQALGEAAAGTAITASRADHVHAMPTAADVGALPLTFALQSISYAATVDLDLAALAGLYRRIDLTGPLTLTTSNRAAGRSVVLILVGDGSNRALTVPAGWRFSNKPTQLAASKVAVLSLTFYGTTDSDCIAAYWVQS